MPSCRRATCALESKTFMPRLAAGSVSALLAAAGLPCWWQSTSGYLRELHAQWTAEPDQSPADACSLVQLGLGWAGFLHAVGHCLQQGGGWSANSWVKGRRCPNAQNLDEIGHKEKQAIL